MANIVNYLKNIKNAIYGKDVRGSIHDAIDAINNESVVRLAKQDEKIVQNTTRQDLLENKYDEQIKNIAASEPQNAEIVDARLGFDTLGSVIKQKVYHFENVEKMKNCLTLLPGDVCETLGYYEANDGGGAKYVVRLKVDEDVDDCGSIHVTITNLVAELIIENQTINFRQLGAKTNEQEEKFDNKVILENYVALCNKNNITYKLFIPVGEWCFSETHICRIGGVHIFGVVSFPGRGYNGTVIKSLGEQKYIWKFGGLADMEETTLPYESTNTSNNIYGLTFSSDYQISYGALCLEYANYGMYDEIFFDGLVGGGLYIRSSWENYFGILNCRHIKDFTKPCIRFGKIRPIAGVNANISATNFDNLMFEATAGDMIYIESGSGFVHNQFNIVNIENSYSLQDGETQSNIGSSESTSSYVPTYFVNGNLVSCTFNTINYTGIKSASSKVSNGTNTYYYKSLFKCNPNKNSNDSDRYAIIINNIFIRALTQILEAKKPYAGSFKFSVGQIIDDNVTSFDESLPMFDIENCGEININSCIGRSVEYSKNMINSTHLYKHCVAGTVEYDYSSSNPLKLVSARNSDVGSFLTTNRLLYPFAHSETKKKKYSIRIKGTADTSYSFVLRGLVNGSNSNKTYSGTCTGNWQSVEVEMNYDLDSPITILNSTAGLMFDTLTYLGEETI